MRPIDASPAALDLYDRLGDGLRKDDQANGGLLLALCHSTATAYQDFNDIVDTNWALALDPNTATDLAWLAQWVGLSYDSKVDAETNRQRIRDRRQWQRGTVSSIRQAAIETLAPGARLDIFERSGTAYGVLVVSFTAQTPNSAATLAAIQAQIPAGHTLTYTVTTRKVYAQLSLDYPTYAALSAAFATYALMEA